MDSSEICSRPKLSEFTVSAKNFSNDHRYLLQHMLKHGCVTKRIFYLTYLKYHVNVTLKKDISILSQCDAEQAELDELIDILIKTCNNKCKQIGLRLKMVTSESKKKTYITLCSDRPFSNALFFASGWKEDEHVLITNFVKEAVRNSGKLSRSFAREYSLNLPNPMSIKQMEHILEILVKEKFFSWSEDMSCLHLKPRSIAELEPLLRPQYNVPYCSFCNDPVINSEYASNCDNDECESQFHRACLKKLLDACSTGYVECHNCSSKLTSTLLNRNEPMDTTIRRRTFTEKSNNSDNDSENEFTKTMRTTSTRTSSRKRVRQSQRSLASQHRSESDTSQISDMELTLEMNSTLHRQR